jgi:glucosamine-6-phosphate deaminase
MAAWTVDQLNVEVHADPDAMGEAAAAAFTEAIRNAVEARGTARLVLASAPSQRPFWHALLRRSDVPWERITVFHMDEYVGARSSDPWSLRHQLRRDLLSHVRPGAFEEIRGDVADPIAEARRVAELVQAAPIDVCVLGIGENGHVAFNDPPADVSASDVVLVVRLAESGRRQQVDEGHFSRLEDVPLRALTLSIPALLSARTILAVVPESRKAAAVRYALEGPVSPVCPAAYLRTAAVRLFLEPASAADLRVFTDQADAV